MYLPFATTSAIFVGGMIRWLVDRLRERKGLNDAQKARVENVGILVASGLIAGEALAGLVKATFDFRNKTLPSVFDHPSYITGLVVILLIAWVMIAVPLANAGDPDEPVPPVAMM